MDYAIIEVGSTQYRVKKGDVINVDLPHGKVKKSIKLSSVLMRHAGKKVEIGNPYIKGANVLCDVLKEARSKKVIAYKYKRRNDSKFKKGHRQSYITLKVKEIA